MPVLVGLPSYGGQRPRLAETNDLDDSAVANLPCRNQFYPVLQVEILFIGPGRRASFTAFIGICLSL